MGSLELTDSLCIFMGYCEGGDLCRVIQKQNGCTFPEQRVVRWFIQIVMALLYLHERNILHRDLKTQNLFLTKSGLIKVGDFGISKLLDSSSDMANTVIGTPFYMSPEILAGVAYNQKSDIWSLGCCLFELLTLRHPFQANDIGSLVFRINKGKTGRIPQCYSEDLSKLTRSLLHYKPQERPSTSSILRMKFIRTHMASFLSDTKQIERKGSSGARSSLRAKRDAVGEPSKGQEGHNHQGRNVHRQVSAEKLSDVSYELDSLVVSGDKMKLASKSRTEKGEAGIRSCSCTRHSREDRKCDGRNDLRQRKWPRERVPDKEDENLIRNVSFFSPARERRRQAIKHGVAPPSEGIMKSSGRSHSPCADLDGGVSRLSNGNATQEQDSDTTDSDSDPKLNHGFLDLSAEDSSITVTSSQDLDNFSNCLNQTLQDEKLPPSTTASCASPLSLESRMKSSLESLEIRIGVKAANEVSQIIQSGNWEEQKGKLECLLGDGLYESVSSLVWTLKLYYELLI